MPGQNFVPRGSEARAGQTLLTPGMRLGYAQLALAAQVGAAELKCGQKPRVAILSTGDEIVPVDSIPGRFQIRNSNSVSLAAQVRLAGGKPVLLGNAMDREDDLTSKIRRGLQEDLLVLSGGVSMGKYDLVEKVLKEMDAEFYFDGVAIRPGKPAVFGKCGETHVFGLPGNPVSTMVTFELFVQPAVDLLAGAEARPLPIIEARLGEALHEKPGVTHFLPARAGRAGSRAGGFGFEVAGIGGRGGAGQGELLRGGAGAGRRVGRRRKSRCVAAKGRLIGIGSNEIKAYRSKERRRETILYRGYRDSEDREEKIGLSEWAKLSHFGSAR